MANPATLQLVLLALASSSSNELDQTTLAKKIKNGNHDAFQSFFDSQYDSLFRFLISKHISPDAAKDLIQQAFIYIWENRAKIDPQKSLRAYIFKIAYTRMLNLIRDNKKFAESENSAVSRNSEKNPQSNLQHTEIIELIRKTISDMPEKRSMVFDMCFMQEFTYRETANALDISVKTVENHMALAFKDVRATLTSHGIKPIE